MTATLYLDGDGRYVLISEGKVLPPRRRILVVDLGRDLYRPEPAKEPKAAGQAVAP